MPKMRTFLSTFAGAGRPLCLTLISGQGQLKGRKEPPRELNFLADS